MTFQPGQSGNPKGYNGNRNDTNRHKIHREVFEQIKGLGHKDALLTLSEIQNDPTKDDALRVTAASALAPFQHPKLQALPTPRYIATPIDVPTFQTIEDAKNFLAKIPGLIARGELDLDFAESLTKSTVAWLQLQYAEKGIDLKAQAQGAIDHEQVIRIEGGLAQLPGTAIIGMKIYPAINNDLINRRNDALTNGHANPGVPANPGAAIAATDPDPTDQTV